MGWFRRTRQNEADSETQRASATAVAERLTVVQTSEELDAVFAAPIAMLYKHSTRCGTSTYALSHIRRFAAAQPDLPVFLVDVHAGRAASNEMAERTGIPHQSPQAFILRAGKVVWTGSHSDVTKPILEEALARVE